METPNLMQFAFGHLLLACIFFFGTYAVSQLFQYIKLTRILFWAYVGMVYVGVVLPLFLVVAGVATMSPPTPSALLLAFGLNVALSTLGGTVYGVRQWKSLSTTDESK